MEGPCKTKIKSVQLEQELAALSHNAVIHYCSGMKMHHLYTVFSSFICGFT